MSDLELLVEKILARCYEDGDCLVWDGCLSGGTPTMRVNGGNVSVRKIMLEAAGRWKDGSMAANTCGNRACVHEAHSIAGSRTLVARMAAERTGYHLSPSRNAKIAAYARNDHGKLTDQQTRTEIVGSDLTQRQLATKYGVSQKSISKVQRGEAYRTYSGPFVGLGARA